MNLFEKVVGEILKNCMYIINEHVVKYICYLPTNESR